MHPYILKHMCSINQNYLFIIKLSFQDNTFYFYLIYQKHICYLRYTPIRFYSPGKRKTLECVHLLQDLSSWYIAGLILQCLAFLLSYFLQKSSRNFQFPYSVSDAYNFGFPLYIWCKEIHCWYDLRMTIICTRSYNYITQSKKDTYMCLLSITILLVADFLITLTF